MVDNSLRNFGKGEEFTSLRNFDNNTKKDIASIERKKEADKLQPGIEVKVEGDNFVIKVNKKTVNGMNTYDLADFLKIATSRLFTGIEVQPNVAFDGISNGSKTHIVVFMDNNAVHYSGGRYLAVLWIFILALKYKVTVITNILPKFMKDFETVESFNSVTWVVSGTYKFPEEKEPVNPDIILGIPNTAGQYATTYAKINK